MTPHPEASKTAAPSRSSVKETRMTSATRDTLSPSAQTALEAPAGSPAGPRAVVTGAPRVFLACAAFVLLHLADDNFFQPADGTSAGDHLLSGTVPLLVIAAGMFAYPRVRAGAQAIIALVTALTGLVVGFIEAGNHLFTVGLSGDDFTGLAAGAAGLVLVGLAARTLWLSRRRGPTRTRQYVRRTLRGALGLVVLAELVAPFAFGYFVTHAMRAGVADPELGAAHEDVTLTT